MSTADGQIQFNVTLPKQVIDDMMKLKGSGLFGNNRAEIARALILDMLKRQEIQALIASSAGR